LKKAASDESTLFLGRSRGRSCRIGPLKPRQPADALKRAASADDKGAVIAAIKATDLGTIVGPISWAKGPVPNVTKTPLVGGQWGRGKDFRFAVVVVSNKAASSVPVSGKLRPIGQA